MAKTIGELWDEKKRRDNFSEAVKQSYVFSRLRTYPDPPRKGTQAIIEAYRTQPWLRAVASKVATDVAKTRHVLYRRKKGGARGLTRAELASAAGKGDLEEVDQHPILDLLNNPNPVMAGRMMRRTTQLVLDIGGEAFWVKERNIVGGLAEFWPMPSHWCTQLPSTEWQFFRFVFRSWFANVPPEDVIWFCDVAPDNPYSRGAGLGLAMSDEFDADEAAAKLIRARFQNRALPDAIVGVEDLPRDQAEQLEKELIAKHGGPDNYGGIHVTSGKTTVQPINTAFQDLQVAELRQFQRDTIVQLYGVPPETMGILENSNRATIDASYYLYAKGCLVPRLDFEAEALQKNIVSEFGDDLELGYENPVPDDKEFALKVVVAVPSAFKIDEVRALAGMQPLEDEKQGGMFVIPSTVKELTDDLSSVEPPPPPVMAPPGGKPLPEPPPRGWAGTADYERRIRTAQDAAMRHLRATVIAPRLREQRDRVVAAFKGGAREMGDDKDLGQAVTQDADSYAGRYAEEAVRNVVYGALVGTADTQHEVIPRTDPAVLEYAATAAGRYVTNVDETTIDRIRALILDGLDGGDAVDTIARAIAAEFDGWTGDDGTDIDRTRSMTIARTEVVAAQNYGINLGLERVGGVRAKAWMTMGDDFVRDSHAAIDGEQVPVRGSFSNGLRWPGDLEQGDPAETVNCRCTLRPVWDN